MPSPSSEHQTRSSREPCRVSASRARCGSRSSKIRGALSSCRMREQLRKTGKEDSDERADTHQERRPDRASPFRATAAAEATRGSTQAATTDHGHPGPEPDTAEALMAEMLTPDFLSTWSNRDIKAMA